MLAAKSDPAQPPLQPLQDPGNGSLVAKVRKAVLRAILEGDFRDRLPPEDELGAMLGVSRTTVRAAVQELERGGLLTRRRAIGTLINRHVSLEALALQHLVGFDWLLEATSEHVDIDVTWQRRQPHEFAQLRPDVAEFDSCVIERRYVADGALAIALIDVVPWSAITATELPSAPGTSILDFTRLYTGQSINNAVADIVPMVVTDPTTTQLQLETGQPFLRLLETHFSSDAAPVAWSMVDLLDSKLRLAVFRPQ